MHELVVEVPAFAGMTSLVGSEEIPAFAGIGSVTYLA